MTAENGFAGGKPAFKEASEYEIITRPVGYF
jgi:hypothetical protein